MHPLAPRRGDRGFTFIDVLCGVAVAAVLCSLAVPSYRQAVLNSRRSDGVAALLALHLAQERHHAQHGRYGSLDALGLPGRSPAGHYRLAQPVADATRFEAHALADGAQAQDTPCRRLALAVEGARVEQSSARDDDTWNGEAANRRCWRR